MASYLLPLVWKNFIIRKRHWFVSFLEIALPLLFAYLIVYIRSVASASTPDGDQNHVEQFISIPESAHDICHHVSTIDDLYFTPSSPDAWKIMTRLQENFAQLKIKFEPTPFTTEAELEKAFLLKYEERSTMNSFGYGVIFNSTGLNGTTLAYNLRCINGDWNTNLKFPTQQWPGPMGLEVQYFNQGFMCLQIMINNAFLQLSNVTPFENFQMAPNPYPPYEANSNFEMIFSIVIPQFVSFSYIGIALSMVPRVVEEKLSGSREWMRLIGLSSINLWLSWIIFSMMFYVFTVTVVTGMLVFKIGSFAVLSSSNFFFIWILIFLFCTNSTAYTAAIATIFSNPSLASVITFFLWVAPASIISKFSNNFPFAGKIASTVFPTMSLNWAFAAISGYEASHSEFSFKNLFHLHTGETMDMTVGVVFLCQIVMTVVYFLLLLYLDAVFPGKYGRARPWYFIFNAIFKKQTRIVSSEVHSKNDDFTNPSRFESISNFTVGLQVRNLRKDFGNLIAVNNVSFDIYKGQITALLGHNGAGKTTLINILTGMYSPTSGAVFKDGNNVFEDFKEFQSKIGLCPQHDLLFPYLTAREHVLFFGMMRGLQRKVIVEECDKLFKLFGMTYKANELPKTLSGGLKRKLCLSVALVGNPEIIVLDEPTSGMDPESRRETWDKLLTIRDQHITLLTTHFMEEADALGDMIAIMDRGKLQCYGTAMFLKKNLGGGYTLYVNISEDEASVTSIVKKVLPGAVRECSPDDLCIVYTLPSENVSAFPHLFQQIEDLINVTGISVSCTTLEDVFLNVDKLSSGHDEVDNSVTVHLLESPDDLQGSDDGTLTPQPLEGFQLFFSRLCALIVKKSLYIFRNWLTYLFSVIFWPFLLTAGAAYISSLFYHMKDDIPSIVLDLELYGSTNVVMPKYSQDAPLLTNYKNLVENSHSHALQYLNGSNTTQELLRLADADLLDYRSNYIANLDINNSDTIAYYSTIAYHSPPISLNLLYNAWLLAKNLTIQIVTGNHPLQISQHECGELKIQSEAVAISFFWLFMLPTCLMSMYCSFCKLHHEERVNSGKLLQFMTGTPPMLYWISAFICDIVLVLLSSGFVMLAVYIFDYADVFSFEFYGYLCLLIILSGVSGIFFSYFMAFFFNNYTSVLSAQVFLAVVVGIVMYLILFIIKIMVTEHSTGHKVVKFLHYILLLYPGYSTCAATQKMISYFSLLFIYKSCGYPVPSSITMLTFDAASGIYSEFVYLACGGLFFFSIIILTDHGISGHIYNYIHNVIVGPIESLNSTEDAYVVDEKEEVRKLRENGYPSGHFSLVVDGIGKKYNRRHTAVKEVSFRVPKGKCFGLLGVNGAGKSTTFKILSGDIIASKGEAVLLGSKLSQNKLEYQSHIGYCPQFDAIIECLTGWEMLQLYASLRGVNPSIREQTLNDWISEFGLLKYCSRRCGDYSGGNKRKLSTAIALIGDPQVIFLDEPTTGVDPVARRKFWNILSQLQKRDQTVIITSHSMDECENVCDRLTIMAAGVMKCIGSISELKNRYGQGFSIMIKLETKNSNDLAPIKSYMNKIFPSECHVRDEHIGLLHYHLADNKKHWSTLFAEMEKLKDRFKGVVVDYVITATSLEQVFLFFAKENRQSDD